MGTGWQRELSFGGTVWSSSPPCWQQPATADRHIRAPPEGGAGLVSGPLPVRFSYVQFFRMRCWDAVIMAVSAVGGTLLRADGDLWGRRRQECPWLRLDTKAAVADGSAAAAWRREGVGARARAGRTGGRVSPESFRNRCCRVATRTVPALCCV